MNGGIAAILLVYSTEAAEKRRQDEANLGDLELPASKRRTGRPQKTKALGRCKISRQKPMLEKCRRNIIKHRYFCKLNNLTWRLDLACWGWQSCCKRILEEALQKNPPENNGKAIKKGARIKVINDTVQYWFRITQYPVKIILMLIGKSLRDQSNGGHSQNESILLLGEDDVCRTFLVVGSPKKQLKWILLYFNNSSTRMGGKWSNL